VRACTAGASGSPCSPLEPLQDLSGNPITIPPGSFGQVTTNAVGQFSFQCPSGDKMLIQVAQSGGNSPQISYFTQCGTNVIGASLAANNTFTGANTFSAAANLNAGGALNGSFTGPTTLSGAVTFSGATTPVTIGGSTQPTPPFSGGIVAPLDLFSDRNVNITTANTYQNAQMYLGRTSTTAFGATQCPGSGTGAWLSACDEPIAVIIGTNTNSTTTTTSALIGLEIGLFGAASDTASPSLGANFWSGLGINVQDKGSTPNTVNLRGANIIVNAQSLPNQLAASGLSRSAVGTEYDINNSSGTDAFPVCQGSIGNCIFGMTANSAGANNLSAGLNINSSSSSGKGWRYGVQAGGISDVGFEVFPSNTLSPTYGVRVSAGGTGVAIGCGTLGDALGCTNPSSTAVFIDSLGSSGVSETQNSGVINLRTKTSSSTGTDWQIQGIGSSKDLDFTHIGDATVLELSPTGVANRIGLQSFNSTTTCTTAATAGAACTTAAITLPVGYADTNYRVAVTGLSPTNVPVVQTVTKSNTTFTVTIVAVTAAAATYASYDFIVTHN